MKKLRGDGQEMKFDIVQRICGNRGRAAPRGWDGAAGVISSRN